MSGVLDEVREERARQHAKWGLQTHRDGTGGASEQLAAAVAKAVCDAALRAKDCTWALILNEEVREAFAETDAAKLRAELIQVAAVAVQWVEAIDRRQTKGDGNE